LQNSLYQLNDEVLKIESDRIQHDFTTWLRNYFALTKNQLAFLDALDEKSKKLLSFDISFAVENRLPISLNKPSNSKEDSAKKIICPKNTSAKSGLIGYQTDGILQININYQG
jgi:hypothetical protein